MDDMVAATNANLALLEKAKRSAQGTAEARAHYIETKRFLSPELYQQSESRPRASSAPRGASARIVSFEDDGAFEQKRDDSNNDRRFEAYLRKQKVMEERLRRLEQQRAVDTQSFQSLTDEKEKLIEERRADHKLVQNLRSQVSGLKSRVDLLVSDEEQREAKILSDGPADLTQQIRELVNKRVQAEMAKATEEIVGRVLREQSSSGNSHLGKSNQSLGDSKIFSRSAGVEQFSSLEREMIRLSGEFERMKTRNAALENACAELKNTSSIREMKAEDAHKKAINAHRIEVETFLGSAARRTADALASVQTHTREIGELRQDLDNFVERIGNVLAEFDMKLSHHDNSKEEVYSVLERLEGDVVQLKNQFAETEASTVRFMEDSLKLARVTGAVENHGRQLQVAQERLEGLDMQVQATSSSVDAHAVPIDMLAKSIDAINEKFESRTDTLRQSIDANKSVTNKALHEMGESHKRTRGKVRDLTETVKGVSQIRQSIEAVLKEVDNRAKQDASWTYSFKTAMQRVEGRVQVMEQTLNPGYHGGASAFSPQPGAVGFQDQGTPLRRDSHGRVGDSGGSGGALDIQIPGGAEGVQATPLRSSAVLTGGWPVPLLGSQFDDIRALISDLRQEIHGTNQAERAELRQSVSALVEDRVSAVEAKCVELVSEANRHAESYVEEQMQNSLDYCAQNLQQVRDLVLDVQVLQDQLLTDHEELGRSLGDKISTLSAEMDTVKSDTAAVSSAVTVEAAARSEEIATLRLQVGSLGETFTQRLQIMQSAATEQSGAGIAEVASKCAEICTNLEDLSTRLGAVESQKLELGVQLSQIHAAIGEGQTALDSRGAQVVTLSQSLEAQESAWREATDSLAGQLQRLTEHSNSKLTGLRGDVDTLKEDLAGHIAFTSECFGDQQSVLEEKFTQVNGDLEAQVQAHHELQSLFTELDAFATQTDRQVRALISDMDVKVTQGHVLLDRSVTDLEHALASHEAGVKGKIAGTEKRLAMQEAAMKERVISLEVKIGSLEEQLRTRVAHMEGSLASQEEQLRESVPIELHRQQDAALELKISQAGDALRAQLFTVKERVTEMESRIAAQEGELSTVAASFAEKLASHQEQVRGELGAGQAAQTSAVSALSEDIMRTVDDRNAGIRELIFQIHELLNAQQEEVTQSTELLSQQIAGVETSIAATDSLLAEQVNEVQQKITALREDVDTKAASEEVEQQISQLRAALSEQINSAQEFVRERCAVHDVEVGRKYADLEHKLATCTSALKVYLTELESKLEIHEGATTTKILDLDQAVSAARQEAQDQALQMEERWTAHGVSLTDSYQAVEAALQGKLADVNQLLQLQEKRLRTAEKSTETRFAEQAKRVEEEVTQLTGRISSLAAALAQEVGGSKESLATLTQQLISMQGQLNDHADEVRTALDTEVAVMRDLVSSEMSDFASSSESVRRLEGWLGNLQHSHDDHLGQFDSSSHAQELCLQKVESAVAALQSTVNSMRSTGTSTDQEQRTVLDRLSAEVASIDSVAKQRLSSLEQRLVRQEALSREKVTEVERRLTHHSEQLAGKLQEYDSILSAHHSRVAALETDHADVTASLQRMSEIEARIAARDAAADAKIEQIEGFIVNQVKAMQSRTLPAPVVRKGADSASAASASTSSARLPTRSAGGASRSVACRLLDTTFEAEGKQQQQKEEEEEEEVQQTGYPNDLSRISRMSISPVRKTAAVARKGDILNELVTLTHADESVLFGSPSAQQQQQQQAYVDDACALEENEEVEEEGDMYSADECEAEGPPAVQHRQQQQSQSLAQSLRQQPQSATMKAKVKGAARPTVKERKGRNSKGSEDSEGEEDVQALSQFNSMIQTVNTDIATLGVHLSAFNPTQVLTPEEGEDQQAAAERQEMERLAAIESLQLKKFNHRRKFQKAIFENKQS